MLVLFNKNSTSNFKYLQTSKLVVLACYDVFFFHLFIFTYFANSFRYLNTLYIGLILTSNNTIYTSAF